jgi:hypothetical protein
MKWVSVVTSVGGVMTIPAFVGIWIDSLLGTKCLLTILGAIFGFVGGMYCLLAMVRAKGGAHTTLGKPFPLAKERKQKSAEI